MLLALGDLAAVGPITLPIWRAELKLFFLMKRSDRSSMLQPRLIGKAWMSLATSLPDPFAHSAAVGHARGADERTTKDPRDRHGRGGSAARRKDLHRVA